MSFVQGNHGSLAGYMPVIDHEKAYAIDYHDGKPYSLFPMGTSLLSVPLVWLASTVSPGFAESLVHAVPAQFEGVIASVYGALAATFFFWLVQEQFGSIRIALASASIFGFATSMWSTATRALWQHGPLVLMLTVAMLILLRARRNPVWIQCLGVPLAAAYVIRPTGCVPIVFLSLYVLAYYRTWMVRYLAGAAIVAIPWFALNISIFHHFLPPYYMPQRIAGSVTFGTALLGNLFSPGRGIFVFSPVLLAALPGFLLALRKAEDRALHGVFAAIVVAHWIVISRFPHWWGGHSFGPRLMTDVLPFLVYFCAFSIHRAAALGSVVMRGTALGTIAALAAVSMAINAQGALSWAPYAWSAQPRDIDLYPERLWDWSDPQFLRGISAPVPMPDFGPWLPGLGRECPGGMLAAAPDADISFRSGDIAPYCLGAGWSPPERWGTWEDGREASLRFDVSRHDAGDGGLELLVDARGFVSPRWPQTDVDVLANGVAIARWSFTLANPAGRRQAAIPSAGARLRPLIISFRPVSPHSPAEAGLSADTRTLGIGLTSLRMVTAGRPR